ncbi:MAG: PAS domain-containing protein, partial [Candidatus Sericytochromatia bacterium]
MFPEALSSLRHVITWSNRPDGTSVSDSPAWRAYTGLETEEGLNWGYMDVIHPEDRPLVMEIWQEVKSALTTVLRIRRHDGIYLPFAIRALPIYSAEGALVEWIGACVELRHPDEPIPQAFEEAGMQAAAAAAEQAVQLAHLRQLFQGHLGEATLENGLGRL